MSRIIEQFLDKKLLEHGRKSKTILIIYKCRHDGITKTRLHKKKRISRNECLRKQTYKDCTDANITSSELNSRNSEKDILETILRTWSSSLETDMSRFFEEPANTSSNSICPDETEKQSFPFQNSNTIKPVYYWNIETENIKQKLEECCDCSKKRKPRTPPLHLDCISRLRLQSFIKSLCENKCNSRLCQPEDEADKDAPTKCKQKRKKNKKKCKKDSSMVSFHVTVPKQTKSVILKNNPTPTKTKNDKMNSNETDKNDDDNNKCLNCPHFDKGSKVQCEPVNQKSTIIAPGDITLSLGNQTITISVKRANESGEFKGESPKVNTSPQKYNRAPTEQPNEKIKCAYSQNKHSSPENAQISSYRRNFLSSNTDKKTCECLQKIKESMEEDLKKFVLSQLKFNEKPCTNTPPNERKEVIKCKLLKNKLDKLRKDRENQDSYYRNDRSFQGQQSKRMKYSGKKNFEEEEEEDYDPDETPVRKWSHNKYPRCVKICLERQPRFDEDETSEEQEEECNCKNLRSTETSSRRVCEHEACPWRNKRSKVKRQNDQNASSGKSSLRCPFYDGNRKPPSKNRMNKCCSCSLTTIQKEKKKCECPKSKKKPPKQEDKCCQCQPNQNKVTQFENREQRSSGPNDTTQDTSGMNDVTVDESTDQSRRTSVEEAFVVNMESPNRNSSKAMEVQESDLEGKDESCSCCICDKESSDEAEIPEYPCDLPSDSEEDEPPIRGKYSSSRKNRQNCDCGVNEEESNDEIRRRSMIRSPKSKKRSRNIRKSNYDSFCGDNEDREGPNRTKRTNKVVQQEITSTDDLIECECEEFEQLMAELEEYCKTKCVNFKVLQNRDYSRFNVPEKKILSITSTPKSSAFMVQNDQNNISASFHTQPNFPQLSKRFFEKNAVVLRSQGLFRINSKKTRSKEKVKYCAPKKTSSKLSDQREDLSSTSGLELNDHDFDASLDENDETRHESSFSSLQDEDVSSVYNMHGLEPFPTALKRVQSKNNKCAKDMGTSAQGCIRNVLEKDGTYNMRRSICLIPALLEEVEMMSFLGNKRNKDHTSNAFIAKASDRNFVPSFPSSLHGRTEIHPRRNRQHQNAEVSSSKKTRVIHQEKNEFYDQLRFDLESLSSQKLLKRIEKSAERIVRGITIRNLESVKRIGANNPKLIVRVFEKYLSEVLNCNAKLLLGRKNLGLISCEDYLVGSMSKLQDLNLTYYLNIENPFSCLIYPSLIEGCGNKNKMSITSVCGDKQNSDDNKISGNCKQKNTCCHCKHTKTQPTNEVKKKCGCSKNSEHKGSKVVPKAATTNRTSFKISDMKLSSQQKITEQSAELKESYPMGPTASSLTSGTGMKPKRKCDCQRKSTMQTIGEGEATVKRCGCAKKPGGHSRRRSRSRNRGSKPKSKKHKCDCSEPCEPQSAITAEGDHQPKKASCECAPDLKNTVENTCDPACQSNLSVRCPCPCRALLKMKSKKEGYISADPYGEKEDNRMCVCQPNSRMMKNMEEEPNELPKRASCGVLCVSEEDKKGHKCDICKLVEGLGTNPDENASIATIVSSDFDQITNILRDTRNDNKLLSNIKCFKNSSGIICQSELVGCPMNGKGGKCKTNTIEIRIKYPNKTDRNKEMSCSAVCTNTNNVGGKSGKETYCEFVKNLQQEISACCAQPDKSELSMLLDSFARSSPEKGERKSSCLKSTSVPLDDRIKGTCSFKTDNISCQTSNCCVQKDEMDVECIFKRGPECSAFSGEDSLCPKRKSSDSLDDWAFEEDKKEIQIGECSENSCMRLVNQPVLPKKGSEVECDVKGSCIREKIFQQLFPNENQLCKVLSTACEKPTRKTSQDKKPPSSKVSPKNKVASKSSSKNIQKSQDKPASLKLKKNDNMKLDKFDQNILAHALDAFLSKGK